MAWCNTDHHRRYPKAAGFTLLELLIVVALVGIIAAIAVPLLLRARVSANESAAIGALRTVNSSEAAYSASAAPGGYASALAVLAAACPGGSVGFISPDLSGDPSRKSGYVITLAAGTSGPGPNDCNGNATSVGYYVTAEPVSVGLFGQRGFATTASGVIFYDANGVAPTEADMAPGGGGKTIQ